MSVPKRIISSGLIVVGATILSRLLGFSREVITAYFFGITRFMDAYNVADTFPHLMNIILIEGIVSTVYIPVFREARIRGEETFWRLFSNLLFASIVFSGIIAGGLIVFGAPVAHSLFPGMFTGQVHVAMVLWKSLSVLIIFRAVMCLFMGALNSRDHFLIPAAGPAVLNGIIILFLLFWPYRSIYLLGWGIIAGTLVQFIIHIPILCRHGMKIYWHLNFHDRWLKKIGSMIVPVSICLLIGNINFIVVVKSFASGIPGAVSSFTYAFKFIQLPVSAIAVALSIAFFPYISEISANREKLGETFVLFFRILIVILVPVVVFLCMFSYPLVKLVFFRGAFNLDAILMTSYIVRMFAVAIVPLSFFPYMIKVYYAQGKIAVPVVISSITIILNLGLYQLNPLDLRWKWLAVGYVVSLLAGFVLFLADAGLNKEHIKKLILVSLKSVIPSIILIIALRQGYEQMAHMRLSESESVLITCLLFGLLYCVFGWIFRIKILSEIDFAETR